MNFEGFPRLIGWELTLDCNLRCLHCASSAGEKRENELQLDESLSICDQFPSLLVKEVVFTGGEPLMNQNLFEMSARLNSYNIRTGIVTNGLLISNEIIHKMKDCNMLAVAISVDGTEDSHDRTRGFSGAYKAIVEAIKKLVEANIYVTVITSVSGININYLNEILFTIKELGVSQWQLQPIIPKGRSVKNDFLFINKEDFLRLGLFIQKKQAVCNDNFSIIPGDACGYFSSIDLPKYQWRGCTAGISSCGITSNGKVKGCLSWPDEIVEGDLRKDDFWSIWFHENSFNASRNYTRKDMKGICKECDRAIECGGGCQSMSLSIEKEWHGDPFCYKNIIETMPELYNKYINIE